MGSAVLDGLIASGHEPHLISATTKSEASAKSFRDRGISSLSVEAATDANSLLASDADLVVLGVKPYQVLEVLEELRGEIGKNAVVISMAAGITLNSMANVLPENPNIIRTMPNTPALVGKGVTGVAASSTASKEAVAAAISLFEKVGSVIEVHENQINSLSAISGSGPAWVFYFIEQWEKVAQANGFSKDQAEVMVRETFSGSLELLMSSSETPTELRKKVTSPGGTTERIIATFEEAKLQEIFEAGLKAAVARAEEIAKG